MRKLQKPKYSRNQPYRLNRKLMISLGALTIIGGIGGISPALAGASSEETSLVAPEVEDVDDPFRRGLDRIADQTTGGIGLPRTDASIQQAGDQGEKLLGLPDDTALMSMRYRVIGVAVSRKEADAQIYPATNQDVMPGDKPMLAYARIGTYKVESAAKQVAINLKSVVGDLLGANFVMRETEEEDFILDVGPMRGVVHAERYCELLLNNSNGIVTDCFATLEFPGDEPTSTFTSTAMLRASPQAVREVIKDDKLFDLETAATKLMTLREGDMLGSGNVNVVKVTPEGIIVVAENGDVDMLPLDYVPERPYEAAATTTQTQLETQLPASET